MTCSHHLNISLMPSPVLLRLISLQQPHRNSSFYPRTFALSIPVPGPFLPELSSWLNPLVTFSKSIHRNIKAFLKPPVLTCSTLSHGAHTSDVLGNVLIYDVSVYFFPPLLQVKLLEKRDFHLLSPPCISIT